MGQNSFFIGARTKFVQCQHLYPAQSRRRRSASLGLERCVHPNSAKAAEILASAPILLQLTMPKRDLVPTHCTSCLLNDIVPCLCRDVVFVVPPAASNPE